MYCEHCGKQIADDSMFCEFCGAKVTPIAAAAEEIVVVPERAEPEEVQVSPKKQRNRKRVIIISVIAVLILIAAAVLFILAKRDLLSVKSKQPAQTETITQPSELNDAAEISSSAVQQASLNAAVSSEPAIEVPEIVYKGISLLLDDGTVIVPGDSTDRLANNTGIIVRYDEVQVSDYQVDINGQGVTKHASKDWFECETDLSGKLYLWLAGSCDYKLSIFCGGELVSFTIPITKEYLNKIQIVSPHWLYKEPYCKGFGYGSRQLGDAFPVTVYYDDEETSDYDVFVSDSELGTAEKRDDGKFILYQYGQERQILTVRCGDDSRSYTWYCYYPDQPGTNWTSERYKAAAAIDMSKTAEESGPDAAKDYPDSTEEESPAAEAPANTNSDVQYPEGISFYKNGNSDMVRVWYRDYSGTFSVYLKNVSDGKYYKMVESGMHNNKPWIDNVCIVGNLPAGKYIGAKIELSDTGEIYYQENVSVNIVLKDTCYARIQLDVDGRRHTVKLANKNMYAKFYYEFSHDANRNYCIGTFVIQKAGDTYSWTIGGDGVQDGDYYRLKELWSSSITENSLDISMSDFTPWYNVSENDDKADDQQDAAVYLEFSNEGIRMAGFTEPSQVYFKGDDGKYHEIMSFSGNSMTNLPMSSMMYYLSEGTYTGAKFVNKNAGIDVEYPNLKLIIHEEVDIDNDIAVSFSESEKLNRHGEKAYNASLSGGKSGVSYFVKFPNSTLSVPSSDFSGFGYPGDKYCVYAVKQTVLSKDKKCLEYTRVRVSNQLTWE